MGEFARVENLDVLKSFRIVLWKFGEHCNTALSDAESEMQRTLVWLENDQLSFWEREVRKRGEAVTKAKDAVRQKKLFKDASGKTPSAQEEEKALNVAQRRLLEAEEKLANTKRHGRQLQREIHMYKGAAQRFSTSMQVDLPLAVARLDRMTASLESYLALNVASAAPPAFDMANVTDGAGAGGAGGMARPEEQGEPDKAASNEDANADAAAESSPSAPQAPAPAASDPPANPAGA